MKPTAIFANQSHDWHRLPIFTENATLSRTEVEYQYDSAGNRVLSISEYNPESNNPFSQPVRTRTEYLTDDSNPTGCSQVLQETQYEVDANGDIVAPAKKIVYAIGHDQISQTVFVWNAGSGDWDAGDTHYFGTDGHGSVRVLWDAVAAIVRDASAGVGAQIYHFDAYGNLLNFAGAVTPITSYLYSGESFDFNLGQQYLRARWYDATTGRFNRLDPFFGNSNDPQSFHKYAYVHGDPVLNYDPTGQMSLISTIASYATGWTGMTLGAFSLLGAIFALGYRAIVVSPNAIGLNTGTGVGPLNHTKHSLHLNFPAIKSKDELELIADSIFMDLHNFTHFNRGVNDFATVRTDTMFNERYAWFDTLGDMGSKSDLINPFEVPVRLASYGRSRMVIADTAGYHMLDGQRRWWVELRGNEIVVHTESYDRPANTLNRIGAYVEGDAIQTAVWTKYFENMKTAYDKEYKIDSTVITEEPNKLGNIPNPWQPVDPYPGPGIY